MLMPKAAMNKNDLLSARENDIRFPREVPTVQAIPVPLRVEKSPDEKLWLCVGGPNRPHDAAAAFRGNMVSHGLAVLHAPIKVSLVDESGDRYSPGKKAIIPAARHGLRKSQVPAGFNFYVPRIEKPVDVYP